MYLPLHEAPLATRTARAWFAGEAGYTGEVRLWPLLLILGLFAALGGFYASITPYRQAGVVKYQGGAKTIDVGAPDERQHVNYVLHLLEGKGLPVLRPGSPDLLETYQSHQPPTYYLLAAGWTRLTSADLLERRGGVTLRWLNVLVGLGSLVGLYLLGTWASGEARVGFAAAAFGLMPMFVALNAAVTNDALLFCECVWAAAIVARAGRIGWNAKLAISLGLVVGVALLTKSTALALGPAALVALALSRPLPKPLVWVLALGIPLLLAAPWFVRNTQLYGDPLGMSVFRSAFTGTAQAKDLVARLGASNYWLMGVGLWTAQSFIGTFGYMDLFMPLEVVALGWAFLLAAFVGWVLSMRRGGEARAVSVPTNGMLATLTIVVALLFVQFNMTYFQGQARYLYPALPAIALGTAFGVRRLLGARRENAWAVVLGMTLVLQSVAIKTILEEFPTRVVGAS